MMSTYESHDSVFQRISFELYSPAEIRKISTKEITSKECFDKISGLSIPGGLYDPQLGPINQRDVCMSCHLNFVYCPGHLSHIEFPKPVYNPALFEQMIKIFKMACLTCYQLPSDDVSTALLKNLSKLPRSPTQWEIYRKSYDECMKYMYKLAIRQCLACGSWRPPVSHKMKQEICIVTSISERWHKSNAKRQREKIMDMQATKRMKLMDGGALMKQESEDVKNEVGTEDAEMHDFQVTENDKEDEDEDENDLDEAEDKTDKIGGRQKILLPSEVRLHLRKLYARESKTILTLFPFLYHFALRERQMIEEYKEASGRSRQRTIPTDMFFMECMLVPPPSCRPPSKDHARGGALFMHPRTANLQRVLVQAQTLRSVLETSIHKAISSDPHQPTGTNLTSAAAVNDTPAVSTKSVVTHCLIGLQKAVNCCLDYDLDRQTTTRQPGLKQLLDSKKGLLRMNMMGKRVNFACRSVISPDPYLAVDEVGLPEVFAMKLTFPEAVNSTNVQYLSELVMNGPSHYPGAVWVEKPNGDKIKIPTGKGNRKALANGLMAPDTGKGATRVHRHLRDGDPMIMNRQPTLHRPSMQVHRARVLRVRSAKTIRMHYANCKAYNADFDGDEMNGHYVQTYDAKAEAQELASVPHQYLVPKDGTPLAGLIQDHIVAAVKLTLRDRFLTRPEYMQLVYTGLHRFAEVRRITLLPPTVLKPARLWTGKQVISTLLINLTPDNVSRVNLRIPGKASKITLWTGKGAKLRDMTDIELVVRDGELLAGILDKAHIGPSQFGLLHCFHEAHGPVHATSLLTAIASVLNAFLQKVGFSLGIKDLLLTDKVNKKRRRGFRKIAVEGVCAFAKTFGLSPEELTPEASTELYRRAHFARRGDFAKKIEELDRNVKMMVKTAQEDITGISIPNGLEVKFPQNNLQLMINSGAKGGQLNALQISVCLGQIELEGKRVPIMLSGRTLPCFRPYDVSPRAGGLCTHRFLTGLPPQELFFHSMAGRDGLIDTAVKTSRSGYLQRSLIKHLEGLMVHYDCTVRESHGEVIQFQYGDDGLDVTKTPFLTKLPFFAENASIFDQSLQDLAEVRCRAEKNGSHRRLRRMWKKIDRHGVERSTETVLSESRGVHVVRSLPPPDTVLSHFLPSAQPGAISERVRSDIKKAAISIKTDIKPKTFERLIHAKCQSAVAQPGDPVGLLAAQSLGEPSTQMTLNTFHFAGRGEMNVTLGIPRLREILMVGAINIKTPCMELPVLNTLQAQQRVKHVILPRFNKILLRDLVTDIACVFDPINEDYEITLRFVRRRELRERWPLLDGEKLLSFMEKFFDDFGKVLSRFEKAVKTDSVTQALSSSVVGGRRGRSKDEAGAEAVKEEEEEEEEAAAEVKREWNVEMDGAEAVAKKGWAGSDDEDGDERDFEGEEEEEEEVNVKVAPEDEFDETLDIEEGGRTKLQAARKCVMLDATDLDDGESEDDEARRAHRAMKVTRLHSSYKKYDFRCKKKIWCSLTINTSSKMGIRCDLESLITSEIDKAVVYSLKNIEKAILDTENPNQWVVRTEGINFAEVYREPTVFDLNRVYTNNIHVMMHTYGVEAGRATICKEVRDVFKHYGIVVDPRHLSLVGDYMTQNGGYRAFNRHGMANHASSLQRMSFETTTKVLRESLVMGQTDTLATPSSAIAMGSILQHSRSLFELLVPIKTYLKHSTHFQ